jgi:hypothetical protein
LKEGSSSKSPLEARFSGHGTAQEIASKHPFPEEVSILMLDRPQTAHALDHMAKGIG